MGILRCAPARVLSDRYALREQLGAGGVGEVWSATDTTSGREVAVKLLRELFVDDPEVRERFLREGRLLARIDSPHVCRVLGSGTDGGTPYLVVERITGRPLDVVLRGGKTLAFPVATRAVSELLAGLAAVHAADVVHRDLKPSNTLLVDDAGAVKLIDFGIGKVLAPGNEPSLTATQATLGSPIYMAPEQIGGARRVDARCDLYAAGTIVYRVLTGVLPFATENPTKMLAMKQLYPAPSLRERTGVAWPDPIEAFLREMLAVDPGARPPTADHARAAWQNACAAAGRLAPLAGRANLPAPGDHDGDDGETPVLPRRR